MKLWILRPKEDYPWKPWYDKAFGFVIRAESEEDARRLANDAAGDENRDAKEPWLDPILSTCEELSSNGDADVILIDFASA